MDKALFRAYVKELVKEQIEESVEGAVKKILPEVLGEAIAEIKGMQKPQVNESVVSPTKPKLSRAKLAEMMGLEKLGDTIVATTNNMTPMVKPPQGMPEDNPTLQAINKDYSQLMKKMGLSN